MFPVVHYYTPPATGPVPSGRSQRRNHLGHRRVGRHYDPNRPLRGLREGGSSGVGLVRLRLHRLPQHRLPGRLQGDARHVDPRLQDKGVLSFSVSFHPSPMDRVSDVSNVHWRIGGLSRY